MMASNPLNLEPGDPTYEEWVAAGRPKSKGPVLMGRQPGFIRYKLWLQYTDKDKWDELMKQPPPPTRPLNMPTVHMLDGGPMLTYCGMSDEDLNSYSIGSPDYAPNLVVPADEAKRVAAGGKDGVKREVCPHCWAKQAEGYSYTPPKITQSSYLANTRDEFRANAELWGGRR